MQGMQGPRLLPALSAALLALLAGSGCQELDPAPDDLDGLFHYLWTHFDAGLDEELAEAGVHLHAAIDGDALDEPVEGTISDLTREDLDAVAMPADTDAGRPVGLYLLSPLACALADVEAIVTDADQAGLYPDDYDAFARSFEGDPGAFLARDEDRLAWVDEIHDGLMAEHYVMASHGGVRRVPELDAGRSPHGPLLVQRAWLPEPAAWEGDSDYYWDQDYQLDVYWEPAAGTTLHVVGLWRSVGMGATTSDHELMQTMILAAQRSFDERTAELCAAR